MRKIAYKRKNIFGSILLWLLLFVVITFIITCFIGSNSNNKYIDNNFQAIGNSEPSFYIDETNHYAFKKANANDFKILQITDSHLGGGLISQEEDELAFDGMYRTIKSANPDLIIVTGDISYHMPVQSGNINNLKIAKQFAKFMEIIQIPWTLCFGNHDNDMLTLTSREKLSDFYSSKDLKYCIYTDNPKDIEIQGYGNQIINIRNSDNSLNNSLVIFDSNSTLKNNYFKYDIIYENQVEWYKNSINNLSVPSNGIAEGEVVPSLVFCHIPLNEYQTAWDLYQQGSSEVEYLYGDKDENILAPAVSDKLPKGELFEEMVALDSTKGIFCGHDHKNNFAIKYKDIQLTFGNSALYLGLFGIKNTDKYRGGTLININNEGKFESIPIFLKDL